MNVSDEKCRYCVVFDDLQMILPSSKQYCAFLANGRHFKIFCVTLFQSIEFYTKNWKTIIDNTFNYIIFNLGSSNRTVSRLLCGCATRAVIDYNWKMQAYRKSISREHGYIISNSNEQLYTNITSTYIIIYKEWNIIPNHLRERVGIKADNTNVIILSLDEVKRLLQRRSIQSIYDLINVKEIIYEENIQDDEDHRNENITTDRGVPGPNDENIG